MIDVFVGSYGETKFETAKNQKALQSQIGLFLICREGELAYNTEYGLNYTILLDSNINLNYKNNYIKKKIIRFFNKKIKRIISVKSEKKGRNFNFKVEYISVYSEEVESIEV